ncbi:MAG: hypothetical protein RMY34_16310 [Aulosira sp. DedQUE10]|nr:hypothetical protein [Aulosira sp. DedQUE10]
MMIFALTHCIIYFLEVPKKILDCCTTSKTGSSVSTHPDEPLLRELQQRQLTPAGRAHWCQLKPKRLPHL